MTRKHRKKWQCRGWSSNPRPVSLSFFFASCTALLHALTVTLIVHRGKARYSRFEDLSDVSLSRNRCRRVYLDQKPAKLGNLGAP